MTPLTRRALAAAGAIAAVSFASLAQAQTPAVPSVLGLPCPLTQPTVEVPNPSDPTKKVTLKPTAALTAAFQSGDWVLLKKHVATIRQVFEKGGCGKNPAPTAADYFVVAWVGETALGETALLTAVVHDGSGEPYVSRLPGLSRGTQPRLFQVFVSDGGADVLASVYMSTREEDPLMKQIPDVAAKILDPLLGLMSANLGTERRRKATVEAKSRGTTPPPPGWATLAIVDLPFARATVKVDMKAGLAPTEAALIKAAGNLRSRLELIDVPYSAGAKALAGELATIVATSAKPCADPDAAKSCIATVDPLFRQKYDGTCTVCASGNCTATCSEEEAKARRLVDTKFRELAAGVTSRELAGATELRNIPLTRHSFGLMTGMTVGRWSNEPAVKIDDAGNYAYDPLARLLTMVTFNSAFSPYDADAFEITKPERHRWFVGAAITPTFGVGVGYSYLPIRGLGINIGYTVLGTNTAADGKKVGEAPSEVNDPFKLGVTGAVFFGLSYNFK